MIDALAKAPASEAVGSDCPPSLHLLTLADTEVGSDIVKYASQRGVLVSQRRAELVENPESHLRSIRLGFQTTLNPELMNGRGFPPPSGVPTTPAPAAPGDNGMVDQFGAARMHTEDEHER